jgi:4-amino-4-deoxy-L-arabinose transferase-like glycosyltransferase
MTSFEFFYMAKAAVTDMTLTFCFTAALLAFLLKHYRWLYLFAALATITKGPIGLAFPGAIILLYLAAGRRWAYLREMKIAQGIIIYLAITAPWYGAMIYYHGSDFIDTFIGFNNITRFTTPEHPEGALWYYYIPVIIAGFFPWTAVLVQSVKASWHTYGQTFAHLQLLNIWAFFILLFFTISQTKLVSYILPMYPPLALIIGWYLSRLWDNRSKGRYVSWPVAATVLFSCAITALIWGGYTYPQILTGTVMGVVLFAACLAGIWYNYRRHDVATMIYVQVAAMTVFSALFVTLLIGPLADELSSRTIAQQFLQHDDHRTPVYIMKFLRPGFAYYSGEYGIGINKISEIDVAFAEPKAYLVLSQINFNSLSIERKQQLTLVAQSADKLLMIKQ